MDADFIAVCMMHLSKYKTLALLGNLGSGRQTLANHIPEDLEKNNPKLKIEVFNSFRVIPTNSSETLLSTILISPDFIKTWYTDIHTEDIIQFLQKLRFGCRKEPLFHHSYFSA